jgi:gliding motility-associated-like protein
LFPGQTACTSSGLPANLRNGLVAYYPFCGNANDASGNGFNGVINGATLAADRYSNLSSAYEFNGVNSWIQANITTLPLGNSPRTISFWAKQRALTTNAIQAGSVFHYGSISQNNRFCCLYWPNMPTVIGERNDACYSCSGSTPFTNISNIFNQWHFVSIAYDGSMIKCYVNGVLYFTALKNYSTVSSLFMIGRAVPGHFSGEYFNGFIDDLSIHNRELSSVEIQQLYSRSPEVTWSTGATTNQITVNPTQTTTYYATVTDGITTCTDSVRITVATVDTAVGVLDPLQVCTNGGQVRMQAGVASGYQWLRNGVAIAGATSRLYTATQTGAYRVALLNSAGCRDTSRTINVSLYPQPVSGFNINPSTQCFAGNQFSFTNTTTLSSGTISYLWSFGNGITSTQASPSYSYPATGTYIVKLVATTGSGCKDSTTRTITVNPSPTATFSVNTVSQCVTGNQFSFTNNSSITTGTITYAWTFGDGNVSTNANPSHSYINAGTYTVKLVVTSALGCKDSITRSVTVHTMPTGTLNTPTTNLLCEGGTVSLSATGGNSYQWFINGGAIVGATSSSYAANQPGTYTVNVVSSNGCVAAASGAVTLQLVRKPTVNFTYDKYCAGFPTQFTDQSNTANSNVVSYNWLFGQGQGTSTLQNPTYTFPTASTYSVSLTVTPVACPSLATSITKPVSTVAPPANQRYTSLNAVENRDLQLEAPVFGGAIYSWAPSSGLSNSTISNPIFNYNAQVDYVITITTGIGCVIKDTQLVRIFKEKEIYVPKGFSPNGDGNNDKIFPRLVGVRTLNYFKVFNRWGQLIFMSTNVNEGWDGTYKGVKQPMEGYVWIAEGVDIDNNIIKRTGTFLLLR